MRRHLTLAQWVLAMGVGMALSLLYTTREVVSSESELVARSLTLVDTEGKPRIRAYVDDEGSSVLVLKDQKGKDRVLTRTTKDGLSSLSMLDDAGEPSIELQASGDYQWLSIGGILPDPRVLFRVSPGHVLGTISDRQGNEMLTLRLGDDGASLSMRAPGLPHFASLDVSEDSGTSLVLRGGGTIWSEDSARYHGLPAELVLRDAASHAAVRLSSNNICTLYAREQNRALRAIGLRSGFLLEILGEEEKPQAGLRLDFSTGKLQCVFRDGEGRTVFKWP